WPKSFTWLLQTQRTRRRRTGGSSACRLWGVRREERNGTSRTGAILNRRVERLSNKHTRKRAQGQPARHATAIWRLRQDRAEGESAGGLVLAQVVGHNSVRDKACEPIQSSVPRFARSPVFSP